MIFIVRLPPGRPRASASARRPPRSAGVARERAVDADASAGNTAEERVKRNRLVPAKGNQSHR